MMRTYDLGLLAGLLGEELTQGYVPWQQRQREPHLRPNLVNRVATCHVKLLFLKV